MRGNGFGNGANQIRTPKTLQCRPVAYSNRGSPTRRREKVVERKPPSFPVSYGGDTTTQSWNNVSTTQQNGGNFNSGRWDRSSTNLTTMTSTLTSNTRNPTPSAATLFSSSSLSSKGVMSGKQNDANQLPADWQELVDRTSGKKYYYNRKTEVTTWTRPSSSSSMSIRNDETPHVASFLGIGTNTSTTSSARESHRPKTISRTVKREPPSAETLFSSSQQQSSYQPDIMPVTSTAATVCVYTVSSI